MKLGFLAFLFLYFTQQLFCQSVPLQSEDRNVTDVLKSSSDAVVLIVVSDQSGKDVLLGSGFIISADGKVITNYHVIKDASSAIAKMANGGYFPVERVLATDPDRDLAVVKVSGRNLPHLELADSDKLAPGEHVFAIGSPLGLQNTVSDGIVSAVREEKAGVGWIQTTAPVSKGNSGGPLLINNGAVVGVITWGVKNGQNLNFAAPINEVKTMLETGQAPQTPLLSRTGSAATTSPKRLSEIHKIVVGSFGNTDAAGLVREKLINRLTASQKFTIVEDADEADAVLSGVVGANIYGRADSGAVRLVTKDGRTLWGNEGSVRGFKRSASSSLADHLAKELLKAMSEDERNPATRK